MKTAVCRATEVLIFEKQSNLVNKVVNSVFN